MSRIKFSFAAPAVIFVMLSSVAIAPTAQAWSDPTISVVTLGGSEYDFGTAIAVDSSGSIYAAGVFAGTVDFDPGLGSSTLTAINEAVFISKFDASGNLLWVEKIDGNSDDYVESLALDPDGNILLTGGFYGTVDFNPGAETSNLTSDSDDVYVLKLNADGEYIWAKKFGGSDTDYGYSITSDRYGNVYTTGEFYNFADFDPSDGTANLTATDWSDAFVSKLDSSGNFIWAKKLGGSGFDVGSSIAVDSNGNVVITGYFFGEADFNPGEGLAVLTSNGEGDAFVSKLDTSGNYIWAQSFGGSNGDEGRSITFDGSGNIYTAVHFSGTVDFDPGRSEFNLAAVGAEHDIVIVKCNSDGGFLWARQLSGPSGKKANEVVVDSSGNIYTTGNFHQTVDFDPGSGTAEITSAGSRDAYVSKMNSSGDYLWAKNFGGSNFDESFSIALDSNGNVFTAGYFGGMADFDPGVNAANLTSEGSDDIFILRLNPSGNAESSAALTPGASSGSSSSDSSTDPVAAAAAVAAVREAAQKAARVDLLVGFKDAKPATTRMFAEAGISGVTDSNIAAVNGEIALLPADSRTSLSSIIKIARKYEIVGMIASERANQVYSNLYVEIGLIPADSKKKNALVNAVRRSSEEDRSSFDAIKIVIAAEQAAITQRAERLALVLSRNSSR